MSEQANLLHLPVRLIGENREMDLELINRHTLEPVTAEEVFTFSGICSNDQQDAYFTRMDTSTTLRNYVEDLQSGVSLQEGHDIHKNPYGRSYHGELISVDEGGHAVRGYWYIIRDLNINGANTKDLIRAIQTGVIRDLSVGFGGTSMWYRCGSCGRNLWDWECPHIPGLEDEEGRMNVAWVMDARLCEVSTVYKGATPGAYIEKAREYVSQGQLSQQNIARLERQYHVRLDDGKRSFFMPEKGSEQRVNLLDQLRQAIEENKIEKSRVYDILSEGELFRQPDDIALRNELVDYATVEGVRQLKQEAQMGRAYLEDSIDQAVKARIRAFGDRFDAEKYRSMLLKLNDLDSVKEEIRLYEQMVKQRFTSGRQTEPELLHSQPTAQPSDFKRENIFEKE
ncbi:MULTISPECIES: hypothetical protein [unclassified Thermoactinomyces]|uniref:hypothetical protein n=1 Tax=unclassified Thermoactinomyces TaxID=2634588 RepID=UPI0018DC7EE8|nr:MULTISPECIES: hypothetical protein [unclassified Thermoactinomyces]MBH8599080.1 hypothetical protein [Thermoactinomyces sp. CICC 10523]MBH8607989.1 hypothetical protein [Thermoactinomyces sp. CICC 10521]